MNDKLIRPDLIALRNGGYVTTFKNLPPPAQAALAHYMAIDGEAWEFPQDLEDRLDQMSTEKARELLASGIIQNYLSEYIEQYGDFKIGYHPGIPTQALIAAILNDEDIAADWANWEDYHAWYMSKGNSQKHDVSQPLWPVILSV